MIFPKTTPLSLYPEDIVCNKAANKARYKIERIVAIIKTRRILPVSYKRPLDAFSATITGFRRIIFAVPLE